ncbi:MAG: carbohydrate ABC transporter permease [Eubacteriales bacterium]|nr:carbohydrate ABC transporter permease [Eubacteriales bacterium]
MKKLLSGRKLTFVIMALLSVVEIYPLIYLIFFSFKDNQEIFVTNPFGLPQKWLFSNYTSVFQNNIPRYLLNSLIVSGATILICGLAATLAAYAIARMRWRLKGTVSTVFMLGLMVPMQAVLLPVLFTLRNLKLVNTYWALILPYAAFQLSLSIFVLTAFIESIPAELEEAACIDGATIFQTFRSVILPLLKAPLATVSIFTFNNSWNEFMYAMTFTSSAEVKTITIGVKEFVGAFTTDWGVVGAGMVIASLPTILFYIFFSSKVEESLVAGALKG